jgi:hypothetical protein
MDKLYHCTHFVSVRTRVEGPVEDINGDWSGLYGDCTYFTGDVSGIIGNCTGLGGCCTGIFGDLDSVVIEDKTKPQFKYKWFGNYVTEAEVN